MSRIRTPTYDSEILRSVWTVIPMNAPRSYVGFDQQNDLAVVFVLLGVMFHNCTRTVSTFSIL